MRREGSPWQGLGVVFVKELDDHLSSARMLVLELLIALSLAPLYFAFSAIHGAASDLETIRQVTGSDPFILLKLFTEGHSPLPSLSGILGFLIPLMAIALGFDAVNGEHNRRTMSRILSQPIYRDALLAGKFLAALATLGIALLCLWLLVLGLGVMFLSVPPSAEEIARSLAFLFVTLMYAGTWLALAILLSIVFRSAATAALVALGLWLFLTLIWPMLVPGIAGIIAPADPRYEALGLPTPDTIEWQQALLRFAPGNLFDGAGLTLLDPSARTTGVLYLSQLEGAVRGSSLTFTQSLSVAWPQAVALIAGVIVLFVAGYVVFQRQEVRA